MWRPQWGSHGGTGIRERIFSWAKTGHVTEERRKEKKILKKKVTLRAEFVTFNTGPSFLTIVCVRVYMRTCVCVSGGGGGRWVGWGGGGR